jgi:hypothetical protein
MVFETLFLEYLYNLCALPMITIMSPSEFSIGVSSISEGHFGGGQFHLSERRPSAVNPDGRSPQGHAHHDTVSEDETETENEDQPDQESKSAEVAQDLDFEPTYDLTNGHEHHLHVGRLLDMKL